MTKVTKEKTTEDTKVEKSSKNEATVHFRAGTRVYTREDHGDDFLALAEQYAGKVGGTVV